MIKGLIIAGKYIGNCHTASGNSQHQTFVNYYDQFPNMKVHPIFGFRTTGVHRLSKHLYDHGYDIETLDHFTYFKDQDLLSFIIHRIENGVRFIGISVNYLHMYEQEVKTLFSTLKTKYPDLFVLVGGQGVSSQSDYGADVYVDGFSENVVVDVLDSVYKGKDFPNHTIVFNNAKRVDATHTNPSWPLPDYSLRFTEEDYLNEHDVLSLELERGCRFKCAFCDFPILGVKEDYSVSEKNIYDQLMENYDKYGTKYYFLSDETINSRNEKLAKLADAVERLPFEAMFTGFVRLDLLHSNEESLDLMLRSNIVGHHYGIETFNRTSGKIIGKGFDPNKNKDMILKVRDKFYEQGKPFMGTCSMIAGLPEQSLESVQEDIDWYNKYYYDCNMHYYPLKINNEFGTRMSAFGVDLDKYGYKVMDKEKFYDKMQGKYKKHLNLDSIDFDQFNKIMYMWENKYMDLVDAWEVVLDFNVNNPNRVTSWMFLSGLAAGMKNIKTFDLNNHDESWDEYVQLSDKHINNYIDDKLLSLYM